MRGGVVQRVGSGLRAAADLVLPGCCAACGEPSATPLCEPCRGEVRAAGPCLTGGGGQGVDGPPCWSAVRLEGAVRAAVSAYKDGGRRDLAEVLGSLLAAAVGRACREDPLLRRVRAGNGPVLVVPVPPAPAARRRRGDDPVGALAVRALRGVDDPALHLAPVLRHTRRVLDQAGLGRDARVVNLEGALRVLPRARPMVAGAACLVVDDVLTTGSTVGEAARALRAAGAGHVAAATLAVRARHLTGGALVSHSEGD